MTSSIRASRSSSCILHRESKRVGRAHSFKTLARPNPGGNLHDGDRSPNRLRGAVKRADRFDNLPPGDLTLLAGASSADLHEPAFNPRVADGDPHGNAEEISVLELYAGTLLAVVQQGVQPPFPTLGVERLAGRGLGLGTNVDDHDVDGVGRDTRGAEDRKSGV